MKPTGVVRKIDGLGRIALPSELRHTMEIKEKVSMEIFIEGEMIVFRKYEPVCIFCGHNKDLQQYHGRLVCHDCVKDIYDKLVR